MWSAKLAFTEMLAEPPSKGWACEGLELEKSLKDEEEGSDQGQEELEAPNWWLPHWKEPQRPRDLVSAPEVAHIFWDHLVRGHHSLWPCVLQGRCRGQADQEEERLSARAATLKCQPRIHAWQLQSWQNEDQRPHFNSPGLLNPWNSKWA